MNILIIAGSPDSIKLIDRMSAKGCKITAVSMSRQVFDQLLKTKGIRIVSGASSIEDFGKIIESSKIDVVVDESSPFSIGVSPTLMEAAKRYQIVYCRYEGKAFDIRSTNVISAKDHADCAAILNGREGRVLLTTGTSGLEQYTAVREYEKRLCVVVLPSVAAIEKCERLNIPGANIFAMQGAASKDFHNALIAHTNASVIVAEDTVADGGTEGKIQAAEESGVPIVIIGKPEIHYINKFRTPADIMRFIENAALAFEK